ncbi:MAG: hypothetical protein LQ352_006719 [Teloschistes flavicans]|nr:MAG: hypothetical protein LQ352_006719 [Teloschistes flavicans]
MATALDEKSGDTSLKLDRLDEKAFVAPEPSHIDGAGISKDGMRVHPQPTADPLDPLNWSSFKKHTILAIVMYLRIIFMIGTLIAFAATIGAAASKDYGGYMAARFFQGFGVSPAATVGMAVVMDLFFEHERGQKLGLWVLAIDTGLLAGPIIGGFMDLVSAEWIQWLTAILFAVLLLLEFAFMPETLYPRSFMLDRMPLGGSEGTDIEKIGQLKGDPAKVDLTRTTKLFYLNLRPVPGMRHPKPWDSVLRFILTFRYPIVVGGVLAYCFTWYWWVLTIITMIPAAYVQYSPQIQGLLFLGLLLGTVFSEMFMSGRLSDSIVAKLAKKNGGVRLPEMRYVVTMSKIHAFLNKAVVSNTLGIVCGWRILRRH